MRQILIATIFIQFIISPVFAHSEAVPEGGTYTVERVIDGGTLKLTNGETVRLIGTDAPNIVIPEEVDPALYFPGSEARQQLQRWGADIITMSKMGQEATEFVLDLFQSRNVSRVALEYDVTKKDKYGRELGYLYFLTCPKGAMCKPSPEYFYEIEKDDGSYLFLNATIIKAGYAQPMTIPPNVKYADLFKGLYVEAREEKRGLWRQSKEHEMCLSNYQCSSVDCSYADKKFGGHWEPKCLHEVCLCYRE